MPVTSCQELHLRGFFSVMLDKCCVWEQNYNQWKLSEIIYEQYEKLNCSAWSKSGLTISGVNCK